MKILSTLLIVSSISLVGCESDDRAQALYNSPVITTVGEFDKCTVKYVNRGTQVNSFYLAKCNSTTTTTNNYTETSGKSTHNRTNTTIVDELSSDQVQKLRELTLNKLTESDKILLNIK